MKVKNKFTRNLIDFWLKLVIPFIAATEKVSFQFSRNFALHF